MVERNEFRAYRKRNKTKRFYQCHAIAKLSVFAVLLLSLLGTKAIESTQKLRRKDNDLGYVLPDESIESSVIHVPTESDSIGLSTGEEESSQEVESIATKSNNVLKNDFFEQANMASDQSSSTVLTSDSETYIDSVSHSYESNAIVLSDACDVAAHTAAGTGLAAGAFTIVSAVLAFSPDPYTKVILFSSICAGVSTAINGAMNWVSCDGGQRYALDTEEVKEIAQKVYISNTIEEVRDEVSSVLAMSGNDLIFQLDQSLLRTRIENLIELIGKITSGTFRVDVETADLMLIITSYASSLFQMAILKNGSDGFTSPCRGIIEQYMDFVEFVKTRMDDLKWEKQKKRFVDSVDCVDMLSFFDNQGDACSPLGYLCLFDCEYCTEHSWVCSSDYGGNVYIDAQGQMDCPSDCLAGHEYGYKMTGDDLVPQFKINFDRWHKSLQKNWNVLEKLYFELQQVSVEDMEVSLCGEYVKPLCIPRFFPSDKDLEICCNEQPALNCGNFEGTCSNRLDECKEGFVCRPLIEILEERPSEESLILQRTAWKKEDNPNVCYKAGEPIPGPFEEEELTTLVPTFNPTKSPVKPPPTPPPPPPPSPGPCFSSTSMVNHMSHSLVPISDINIGDSVQSKTDGSFSRVYALEKNHYGESEFYQFHTSKGVALELTDRHMVYLKNKSLPVPARDVRVGDVLKSDDHSEEVTKIEVIHQDGYYNPLTEDGTIILNDGVVASSFSVAKSSSSEFFDGPTGMIHYHTLSHLGNAPLRFVCKAVSFNLCTDEQYLNEEGLHKFIVFLKTLSNLPNWQQVAVLPVIFGAGVLFTLLEFFYDLGEAFYAIISSTSVEAATSVEGSFGFLFTFSLTVAALVPSAIFLWRKKYHLSYD